MRQLCFSLLLELVAGDLCCEGGITGTWFRYEPNKGQHHLYTAEDASKSRNIRGTEHLMGTTAM
jgi:hypothetical protein